MGRLFQGPRFQISAAVIVSQAAVAVEKSSINFNPARCVARPAAINPWRPATLLSDVFPLSWRPPGVAFHNAANPEGPYTLLLWN